MTTPDREENKHRSGQWVLLEAKGRLLSIGRSLFHGQAPRAHLNALARRHLLPLLTATADDAKPASRTFVNQGVTYRAEVIPILGPSGAIHAVLGTYVREGESPDPRPEIGAWEWDLYKERTFWNADLFKIYGFPQPPEGRTFWEAPEWFSLFEQGSFPHFMSMLSRLRADELKGLQIHFFGVARADTGAFQRLRLAGRTVYGSDNRPQWFCGVTVRVDGWRLDSNEDFNRQRHLDAALILNPFPVCIVDLADLRVMLNHTSWRQVGVDMPNDGSLNSVVHTDDQAYLSAFLVTAPMASAGPSTTTVRFSRGPVWRRIHLAAVRLTDEQLDPKVGQVMIRLQPADPDEPREEIR